jgi:serine/threonine protein kinase
LFIKEAKLLEGINHPNVVKFYNVVKDTQCYTGEKLGMMMEYCHFDFKTFGEDFQVSSLKEFLETLDQTDFAHFEHVSTHLATDICSGLQHLHNLGIVHRDLKPDNILVSNQHYCHMEGSEFNDAWIARPVVAKLTDFGEGRAMMLQTASVVSTQTCNVARGTPAFMAPEVLTHDGTSAMDFEDLMLIDIWAFAMVLFVLLNPDRKFPYQYELERELGSPGSALDKLKKIMLERRLPEHSIKYDHLRNTQWATIKATYDMAAVFEGRPTIRKIHLALSMPVSNSEGER